MRVLIACEYSGVVRSAFARRGRKERKVEQMTEWEAHYKEGPAP